MAQADHGPSGRSSVSGHNSPTKRPATTCISDEEEEDEGQAVTHTSSSSSSTTTTSENTEATVPQPSTGSTSPARRPSAEVAATSPAKKLSVSFFNSDDEDEVPSNKANLQAMLATASTVTSTGATTDTGSGFDAPSTQSAPGAALTRVCPGSTPPGPPEPPLTELRQQLAELVDPVRLSSVRRELLEQLEEGRRQCASELKGLWKQIGGRWPSMEEQHTLDRQLSARFNDQEATWASTMAELEQELSRKRDALQARKAQEAERQDAAKAEAEAKELLRLYEADAQVEELQELRASVARREAAMVVRHCLCAIVKHNATVAREVTRMVLVVVAKQAAKKSMHMHSKVKFAETPEVKFMSPEVSPTNAGKVKGLFGNAAADVDQESNEANDWDKGLHARLVEMEHRLVTAADEHLEAMADLKRQLDDDRKVIEDLMDENEALKQQISSPDDLEELVSENEMLKQQISHLIHATGSSTPRTPPYARGTGAPNTPPCTTGSTVAHWEAASVPRSYDPEPGTELKQRIVSLQHLLDRLPPGCMEHIRHARLRSETGITFSFLKAATEPTERLVARSTQHHMGSHSARARFYRPFLTWLGDNADMDEVGHRPRNDWHDSEFGLSDWQLGTPSPKKRT